MASVPASDQGYWRKRVSNNAAAALLVFTCLHITCFTALSGFVGSGAINLLGIAILVGIAIPAMAGFEARWEDDKVGDLTEAALAARFRAARLRLWIAALLVPFLWAGVFLGLYTAWGKFAG